MDKRRIFTDIRDLMPDSLLIAVPGIFLASVLRGFTGFGFGLAAAPMLSLALPPARVVPLVVLSQVAVGCMDLRQAWRACDWRAIRRLLPGLVLGLPLGLAILRHLPPDPVRLAIGLLIAGAVILLWRGTRLPPHPSRFLTAGVGILSGTISGFSSMGGPPVVVYLIALGHDAARVRATASIYFMLSGTLSAVMMLNQGMVDPELLTWTVLSIPALFLGSWVGTGGFHRSSARHHRNTALMVLSALSIILIVRALGSV